MTVELPDESIAAYNRAISHLRHYSGEVLTDGNCQHIKLALAGVWFPEPALYDDEVYNELTNRSDPVQSALNTLSTRDEVLDSDIVEVLVGILEGDIDPETIDLPKRTFDEVLADSDWSDEHKERLRAFKKNLTVVPSPEWGELE